MVNRIYKPGRPPATDQVAPPGHKWCNYGEHFALLLDFTENDSYCKDCRKEYNRKAYLERKAKIPKAEILQIDVKALCECGAVLSFSESGEWACPECGQEWKSVISARIEVNG